MTMTMPANEVVAPAEILPAYDLSALPSAELRSALAHALTATAMGLMRAAAIWAELERRGEPLAELRSGLATWLPAIARGELAAEAVIAFAGQRMLLQRLANMPIDRQRRLAAGEPITVAVINAAGEIIGENKPLARLSSREALLALEAGEVRALAAQTRMLSRGLTRPHSARPKSGHSTAAIRADRQRGLLVIGRSRVAPDDLAQALRALGLRLAPLA